MANQTVQDVRETLERNRTALNNRDMEGYLDNQDPQVTFLLPGGVTLQGRDQVRGFIEAMWRAFPDGQLSFGQQVFDENGAATEVIFAGTHSGPLAGQNGPIPPTGNRVKTHSASILRMRDGRIISEHGYGDPNEMMMQLGLMPTPAQQ
jgi:predicted ester cyclase